MSGARLRSPDTRCAVLLIMLSLLFFLPALLQPSHVIYPSWSEFSDLAIIHWPKVELIRETLASEYTWPLWSPYALSGQPLAANQLAMLFYPPALLLLVGPAAWAFSLFYALHIASAGIGTYWLARGLGLRPQSALLAGAIFSLSGKLLAHTAAGHVSLVAAITWTPWAFAFLHRALTQKRLVFSLLAGVALAAQATTHTYALIFTAYGLLLYGFLHLMTSSRPFGAGLRALMRQVPRLAVIPLAGILLGAAQILPLAEMSAYSNRALSWTEATLFSLSPLQTVIGILLPAGNAGHELIIYPGLLTLGLAAASWRAPQQRPMLVFATLTLLGAILALGSYTPLYRLFYMLLPGVRWVRTPSRLWFFVALGLAVLAAYGFEQCQELWRRPHRRTIRLVLFGATAFAVALSLGAVFALGENNRGAWGLGLFGLLSGGLLLWAVSRRPSRLFSWLALLVILADLGSFGYTLFDLLPEGQMISQGGTATNWLADQPGLFRVYSPSYSLPQPAAAQAGLQQIDGVEPVHLADYDRFMALAGGYGEDTFSVTIPPFPGDTSISEAHRDTTPDLQLLGLLNGEYLATAFPLSLAGVDQRFQSPPVWVYENKYALPRAFVVHQVESTTQAEIWARLPDLDPSALALVEDGPPMDEASNPTPAEVVEYTPNRIVVEVDLANPGLLILSEMWYPGWWAYDNAVSLPMWRADAILRSVYLEPGSHRVEFAYRPWTVRVGVALSATATALLAGWLAVRGGRTWVRGHRRRSERPVERRPRSVDTLGEIDYNR